MSAIIPDAIEQEMRAIFASVESAVEATWSPQTSTPYGQASSLPIPTSTETLVPDIPREVWLLEFAFAERRSQDSCHLLVPKRESHRPRKEPESSDDTLCDGADESEPEVVQRYQRNLHFIAQ